MIRNLQLTAIAMVFCTISFAQATRPKQVLNRGDWTFVENRGQLTAENPEAANEVKYYARANGITLYCKANCISFVFSKTEENKNVQEAGGSGFLDRLTTRETTKNITCRTDFKLMNANPLAQIVAADMQTSVENYYSPGRPDKGIEGVKTYKTLVYKEIYPHIDMVLYARPSGMKYEFVIRPGGTVADIKLLWDGLERMNLLKNGGISYIGMLGKMTETAPVTWQQDGKHIGSHFVRKDNVLRFSVNRFDKRQTLVIDPNITWSTYFGGSAADQANGVVTDAAGNAYIAGTSSSVSGIATAGAYQTSTSNTSAFISKFSATGKLIWSTYYGDSLVTSASGIAIDPTGYISVAGYREPRFGLFSVNTFVLRFNLSGTLSWDRQFGNDSETAFAVAADANGNIYITGASQSKKIATKGAFQTVNGGIQDAFIAKYSSAGSLEWSTYFGGNALDVGNGICVDPSGYVYITGNTQSTSGIATSGAYQTSFGGLGADPATRGGGDAFVAKFTNAGAELWATYLGGNYKDEGFGIATDTKGNVFITGQTFSDSGMATVGAYQSISYTGSFGSVAYSAFVAKFATTGACNWCTYYGGSVATSSLGLSTDSLGNVYTAGYTYCLTNIATYDAAQPKIGGQVDAYIAAFSGKGDLGWATYFGGEDYEYGRGINVDRQGNLWLTGDTKSTTGIATKGAFQTQYASNDDAYLVKYRLRLPVDMGVVSFVDPVGKFCSKTRPIKLKIKNFGNETLDSARITYSVFNVAQPAYHWHGKLLPDATDTVTVGSFSFAARGLSPLKAWTSMPNGIADSVPQNDTTVILVDTVVLGPHPFVIANKNICDGMTLNLGGNDSAGHTYSWTSVPPGFKSSLSNPHATPDTTITYTLLETITATGCTGINYATITVFPLPDPKWSLNFIGQTAYLQTNDITLNDTACHWTLGDGDSATGHLVTHNYNWNGNYDIMLKVVNSHGCFNAYDSVIDISGAGVASAQRPVLGFEVFPVPFQDHATIKYSLAVESMVDIALCDVTGKEIAKLAHANQAAGDYQLDLGAMGSALSPGVYMLRLQAGNLLQCVKLVK